MKFRAACVVAVTAACRSGASPQPGARCQQLELVESAAYASFAVQSLGAGDLDGDGIADLYVRGIDEGLPSGDASKRAIVHGSRDARSPRFEMLSSSAYGCDHIVIGDVTGDGIADVTCVHTAMPDLEVNAGPSFGITSSNVRVNTAAAWRAHPGAPLVALDGTSELMQVTADATGGAHTSLATAPVNLSSIATGDVDGDGADELLVAGSVDLARDELSVFTPTLGRLDYTIPGGSIELADLDHDGALDLLSFRDDRVVVMPLAAGVPGQPVSFAAPSAPHILIDLDGDALPDVLFLDFHTAPSVMYATGDRTLELPQTVPIVTSATQISAATAADIDGDGVPELILADDARLHVLSEKCD